MALDSICCAQVVETWEPTWFCIDGEPLSCAGAPTFSGADAEPILKALQGPRNQEFMECRDFDV